MSALPSQVLVFLYRSFDTRVFASALVGHLVCPVVAKLVVSLLAPFRDIILSDMSLDFADAKVGGRGCCSFRREQASQSIFQLLFN